MSIDTVFYIVGSAVAILAVVISFAGLKLKGFPSRAVMGGIIAVFAVLVVATSGLAVAVARHEQDLRQSEQAEAEHQTEESSEPTSAEGSGSSDEGSSQPTSGDEQAAPNDSGESTTLSLAASETELAYDKTELTAAAGEVTLEFDNPAAIPHDVVIRDEEGNDIARTDVITEGTDSLSADLDPGEYTFYCSIPGHEEAGMVGTLTVE